MTLQERDFNSSAPRGERADHPEAAPHARDPQPPPLPSALPRRICCCQARWRSVLIWTQRVNG